MTPSTAADQPLDEVAWDLDPLLHGDPSDPQAAVDAMLSDAQQRADAFSAQHAGKVADLDADGLVAAMRELEAIYDLVGRAGGYAQLRFSTDTADPATGALMQRVQERATGIETALLFFELEWAAVEDEQAEALLAHDGL